MSQHSTVHQHVVPGPRIRGGRHRSAHRPTLGARLVGALTARLRGAAGDERGDVPGWVLITLMTAGIVVALWAVASDQIVAIFNNAMAPFVNRSL